MTNESKGEAGNSLKGVVYILEHDFRNFFRYKWWLVGLVSMNLADLFIMAVVYNHMISATVQNQIKSYFNFFAPRTSRHRIIRFCLHDRTRNKHGTPQRSAPLYVELTHYET